MINTTCCIWINPSGEAEGYVNTTEPATWLWKMGFWWVFLWFIWFWLIWVLETMAQSVFQTLEVIWLIIIMEISWLCYVLFMTRMSGKGTKRNSQLKNREPKIVVCEYHRDEVIKRSWLMNTTQRIDKICENYRAVANSGANVLNFDHVSQLCWKSDLKKRIVFKRRWEKIE